MTHTICEMHTIGPRCRERFLSLIDGGAMRQLGTWHCGVSRLRARYVMSRPNPPFHLLLGTLGGQAQLTTPNEIRTLSAGEILIAPAGQAYRYEIVGPRGWQIVWFHINPTLSRVWWPVDAGLKVISQPTYIRHLADDAERLLDETGVARPFGLEARLAREASMAVTLRRWVVGELGLDTSSAAAVERVFARVAQTLSHAWSLGELAEAAGLSAGHLNRLSRAIYGRPACRQLAYLRMEYAMQLLSQRRLKVSAAAAQCGYSDEFAFAVAFKRHFGVPPGQIRRL
jgi:AraC-like DNA-binding protein